MIPPVPRPDKASEPSTKQQQAIELLAKPWPGTNSHQRQQAHRALAGGLLRGGLPAETTEALIGALAEATGDEEATKRIQIVQDTAKKLKAEARVEGWPSLINLLGSDGESLVSRLQEILGLRRIVAVYDYQDEAGCLRFQTVRYDPKDFRQRRPDGKGGWIWSLAEVPRLLYRLPELFAADVNTPVFIPEGEKDVDNLRAAGLIATTNPMGAGKWRCEFNEALRGRQVVILPDNDTPGREHAQQVAQHLHGVAASVKVLALPNLPDGGDVSDWLAASNSTADLKRLAETIEPPVELDNYGRLTPEAIARTTGNSSSATRPRYLPLPRYREFPVHLLPPVVSEYVTTAAQAIGCNPSLVALPAIATTGAAIGNSRALCLKRGWIEPCCFWTLTVIPSGKLKSPAYDAAVRPYKDRDMNLFEAHQQEVAQHKVELQEWQDLPRERRGARPKAPGEAACLTTSDTTIEAIGELLRHSPRGILMARDELDAWFQSFTRYKGRGGGTDRPHWLEMNRGGLLDVSRVNRGKGRLVVRRALVGVTGTIQPGILARALDRDALHSGLGARFLFAMPPARKRVWSEDELPDALVERYQHLLSDLLALELADSQKRTPHVLGLAGDAKQLWTQFFNEWGQVQDDAEDEQAAAWAKIEAYAARFMLWHHVIAHVAAGSDKSCSITTASAEAGIALARWFAGEATRVYCMLAETQEERSTRLLVEWISRHSGRTTVRQLQKSNALRWPSHEVTETALQGLVNIGLARWEEVRPDQGGHPVRWCVLLCQTPDTSDTRSDDDGPDDGPDVNPPPDTRSDTRSAEAANPFIFQGATSTSNGTYAKDTPAQESRVSEVSSVGHDLQCQQTSPTAEDVRGAARTDCQARVSEPCFEQAKAGTGDEQSTSFVDQTPDTSDTRSGTPYLSVFRADQLPPILDALGKAEVIALDLETTGLDPRKERTRLLSLALPATDGTRLAYLIDLFAVDASAVLDALAGKDLLGHNLTFDLAFLDRIGFTLSGKVHDLLHLSRILHAGEGHAIKHTLAAVVERELGETLDKAEQRSDWSGLLTDSQLTYAARDVLVLPRLYDALKKKLAEANLEQTAGIETRCLPAVAWMSSRGVAVDQSGWLALVEKAEQEAARLKQEMAAQAPIRPGEMFSSWNWDSPADVLLLFRDCLGVAVKDTSDETLATISHPIAAMLRSYREAMKRTGTYGRAWLKHVASDGRVYANWNQTGSEAGRMSCKEPNMQQLPRDKAYRRCVVAPPGRVLVKADYSQIELRIAAKESGDEALLEAYRQGIDVHRQTAQRVLGKEEVSKEDRQLAKALNFGLLYGMGAKGFRLHARSEYGLDLTDEQALEYRAAFFRIYRGLEAWHRKVKRQKYSETRTLAGRRRLIPHAAAEKTEDEKRRFEAAMDRQRLNTPIQGTGADGLKLALALLWERRDQVPGAFPVMAVHDEIVVEADADQADATAAWLKQAMLDAMAPLIDPVPVEIEVKVARTWPGD
jgi:DNA polymerase-1